MSTLFKALVYLAGAFLGFVLTLVFVGVVARPAGACPPPCDAPAMNALFAAILVGPIVGLLLGHLAVSWLDAQERGKRQ